MLVLIHVVHSTPQFFGQSFSSSSFTDPSGQIVSSSIYTDSDGNRVINGQNVASNAAPAKTVPPPVVKPAAAASSVPKKQDNSGKYVHDNSGAYKGN